MYLVVLKMPFGGRLLFSRGCSEGGFVRKGGCSESGVFDLALHLQRRKSPRLLQPLALIRGTSGQRSTQGIAQRTWCEQISRPRV